MRESTDKPKGEIIVYLATPYSHHDPLVRERRFNYANKVAGQLMQKGFVVFSPISHSHPIDLHFDKPNEDWEFWKKQDMPFVRMCDELHIITSPGWTESKGLNAEIDYAMRLRKKIVYREPV